MKNDPFIDLNSEPESAWPSASLGVLHDRQGKPTEDLDDFYQAVDEKLTDQLPVQPQPTANPTVEPGLRDSLLRQAEDMYRQGRPGEAAMLYEEAFAIQAPDARQLAELGHIYAGQGLLLYAEQLFRMALQQDPGLAGAWFNLGVVLAKRGEFSAARQAAQQAQRLEPGFTQAAELVKNIDILAAGQ